MIDGHNDLPWAMRKLCGCDLDAVDLTGPVPEFHTDIGRLRAGGVTGQFWSVYVPSTLDGGAAVTATLEQIDFVHAMVRRYPDTFSLALTADGACRAQRDGRIASLIGIEGGHSINGSLGVLRAVFELGARYMTLTHNDNVAWADSATDETVLGGLSSFGTDVIREMNRLGMLVDLSHVSDDVMRQSLALSEAPVMFSHSSARALCDVRRNVPDDVLRRLATNGGICMVTFVPDFVSPACARWFEECRSIAIERGDGPRDWTALSRVLQERVESEPPPQATIADVVAHIEHVREVAGVEHVGIGGDFDGCAFTTTGLEDVSCYPRLFEALGRNRWSERDLERLRCDNVIRVLGDAEAVARRWPIGQSAGADVVASADDARHT